MDLNERLRKIEEDLSSKSEAIKRRLHETLSQDDRRMAEAFEKSGAGAVAVNPAVAAAMPRPDLVSARVDLSSAATLRMLDGLMESAFEVGRHLGGSMQAYPTTYCETPREYAQPILAGMPMPDAQREQVLRQMEATAGQDPPAGLLTSLGVHIPGVGCFINGWRIGQIRNLSPREVFRVPEASAQVLATAAHEKWGHGFIAELTACGKEKQSVQLGMNHLAAAFGLRTVDTPAHARLAQQWEILFHSSHYVEEGFATWVERYLVESMADQHPHGKTLLRHAPTFEVEAIAKALSRLPNGGPCVHQLGALFSPQAPLSVDGIHAALQRLIAAAEDLDGAFAQAVGMPAPYAIGYCLMDAIARRHGPKCVPYAVATACNIQYDLAGVSNQDLREYVETHPSLNVNTRLALQMYFRSETLDDVRTFLKRAREELGLASPKT